jgi:DNA-binding response OmpR family regulator
MSAKRILVVEDERHIAEGLRLNLVLAGYEVQVAENGELGLIAWKEWKPDLMVLDLMMPVIDGFEVLKQVREHDERIPILILSARSEVADKVRSLKIGGDDHLAKPFDLDEFLLRVDRLLKRASWTGPNEVAPELDISEFSFGPNHIDFVRSKATTPTGEVELTVQEVRLLLLFIQNRGVPLSRKKLLQAGWGYSEETSTRTVDNFMVRLRRYFEQDPKNPRYFKGVRSVGYVFDA